MLENQLSCLRKNAVCKKFHNKMLTQFFNELFTVSDSENFCGQHHLTNLDGILTSPGYILSAYPNNSYCTWTLIRPYGKVNSDIYN